MLLLKPAHRGPARVGPTLLRRMNSKQRLSAVRRRSAADCANATRASPLPTFGKFAAARTETIKIVMNSRTDAPSPESTWVCPSCGSTATARYCGNCGERALDAAVEIDGAAAREPSRSLPRRLQSSLRAPASPPGRLTGDWIRGRRVGYLAPVSLFLWINVAFFLVQSASGVGILTWPLRIHLSEDYTGWLAARLLAQHRTDAGASTGAYADVF